MKTVKPTVAPATAPVLNLEDLDTQIANLLKQKRELVVSRVQPLKDSLAVKLAELNTIVAQILEGDADFIPPFTVRALERTEANLLQELSAGPVGKTELLSRFSGSNKVITVWLDEQVTAKVITKTAGTNAKGQDTITFAKK